MQRTIPVKRTSVVIIMPLMSCWINTRKTWSPFEPNAAGAAHSRTSEGSLGRGKSLMKTTARPHLLNMVSKTLIWFWGLCQAALFSVQLCSLLLWHAVGGAWCGRDSLTFTRLQGWSEGTESAEQWTAGIGVFVAIVARGCDWTQSYTCN